MKRISIPIILAAVCGLAVGAQAADITKADNNTNLITGSSWVGGTAPTGADTAVFDATFTQAGTLSTGGPLAWLGVRLDSGTAAININNTVTANHVGLGSGGIDMSAAQRDFTIASIQAQADQTWTVGEGRTLTLGGTKLDLQTYTVTLAGAGTFVKTGGTTMNFIGAGNSIGAVTINGGTLAVGAAGDLAIAGRFNTSGSAKGTLNIAAGGTISADNLWSAWGTTMAINGTLDVAGQFVFSGQPSAVSGTGTINANELRTQNYSTSNVGGVRFNIGAGGITMGPNPGTLNFGDATIGATADWTGAALLGLTSTTTGTTFDTAGFTVTQSAVLSGTGGLNKAGAGTLILQASNTFSGNMAITGGELRLTGTGRLGNGNYAGTIANNGTLTLAGTANQTLSGAISGTGAIVKTAESTGLLTLSGASSYAGPITIDGGTVNLTGSLAAGSTVAVN
ncbi:MAG: autotransporter-associated beta strand repeat-containing protein, partial [Kiritimatiellae bacterium]|nr:autotransporter-associated beta strand repeat-containing protein [Kiritimatiellia bacterium]